MFQGIALGNDTFKIALERLTFGDARHKKKKNMSEIIFDFFFNTKLKEVLNINYENQLAISWKYFEKYLLSKSFLYVKAHVQKQICVRMSYVDLYWKLRMFHETIFISGKIHFLKIALFLKPQMVIEFFIDGNLTIKVIESKKVSLSISKTTFLARAFVVIMKIR